MFRTTTTRLTAVAAVASALIVAPQALATTNAHGAKATAKRVHRVTPDDQGVASGKLSALSTVVADACRAGLIGDRTMGGGNNNYDYYGDPCTT
jgi:hypothetical protein